MKVLVVTDDDGHVCVMDISTSEKRQSVYFAIFQGWYENGTGNYQAKDAKIALQYVIAAINRQASIDEVLTIYDEVHYFPSFGGRWDKFKEVDVAEWDARFGTNIS